MKKLLRNSIYSICFATTAIVSSALSQNTNMYETIAICAAGADFEMSADMRGSLQDLITGDGAQGKSKINTATEWLKLFPDENKAEAAKLYHACVKDLLSQNNVNIRTRDRAPVVQGNTVAGDITVTVD